jgi:hypothetical protein
MLLEDAREPAAALELLEAHDRESIGWYLTGLARARTVARIGFDLDRGYGTGFLLRGRDLADRLGDAWLLLTSAHVVSADPEHHAILRPSDAVVSFEALAGDRGASADAYRVRRVVWASGPGELDATLLELDRPVPGIEPHHVGELAGALPPRGTEQRVSLIGHPGGRALSFSVRDNRLLDHEDPLLHYVAPTESGSSGSPVYDAQWRLIGVHHAAWLETPRLNGHAGTYAAAEGIWIQAIRRALA